MSIAHIPTSNETYEFLDPLVTNSPSYLVWKAIHRTTHSFVDVIIFLKAKIPKKRLSKTMQLHKTMLIPSIRPLFDFFEDEMYYYLVVEHVKYSTITDFIENSGMYNESIINDIFSKIVITVEQLRTITSPEDHQITLDSFAVDESDNILYTDFIVTNDDQSISPTIAPEIITQNSSYTEKTDVWALGIILYYMLSKSFPFKCDDFEELKRSILNDRIEFPPTMPINATDLLVKMLKKNPETRISIPQIKEHKWCSGSFVAPSPLLADVEEEATQKTINEMQSLGVETIKLERVMSSPRFDPEATTFRILKRRNTTASLNSGILTRSTDSFNSILLENNEEDDVDPVNSIQSLPIRLGNRRGSHVSKKLSPSPSSPLFLTPMQPGSPTIKKPMQQALVGVRIVPQKMSPRKRRGSIDLSSG